MTGTRILSSIIYGAWLGAIHSLQIIALGLAAWVFREPIAAMSAHLAHVGSSAILSAGRWLATFIGLAIAWSASIAWTITKFSFHVAAEAAIWVAPILGNAFLWIASAIGTAATVAWSVARKLILALWIFVGGEGPYLKDDTPLQRNEAEIEIIPPPPHTDNPHATILETPVTLANAKAVIRFAVFPSSWCWREASPEPAECASASVKGGAHNFTDALRTANTAILDASHLVIIGVASCDGSSQQRNEKLALERAHRLEAMVRQMNSKDRKIIVLSLGQFKAKDCSALGAQERARQRPIIIAGVYSDGNKQFIENLVIEGLKRNTTLLPQAENYSRKPTVP